MKFRICIVCLLLAAFLIPSEGQAFDKQRKGFVLGLGAGYGSATIKFGDLSQSHGGVATTLKLGAGLSENVMLYYSNRVIFFSIDGVNGTFVQGASAVAVSYFLIPTGPSFYFSGELGLGALNHSDNNVESDSGFAWSLGAGYEFVPTWTFEINYYAGSYDDPAGGSNWTFAVTWLAY